MEDLIKISMEDLKKIRHHIHRNPELSGKECKTREYIHQYLQKHNATQIFLSSKTNCVVGVFGTGKETILLRADMDALPIQELNTHDHVSQNEGVMHACGHDGHMAVGLSIAKLLHEKTDEIKGKIVFVFQPAEEIGQGAKAMIADGILDGEPVDYALAVHLWADKPYGWIGIPDGPVMGGSSDLIIDVIGKGGHAARPDLTIDPLYIASQIVVNLQPVIARSLLPNQAAVVSITQIEASDRRNIIANKVSMAGTLRWFDNQTRG